MIFMASLLVESATFSLQEQVADGGRALRGGGEEGGGGGGGGGVGSRGGRGRDDPTETACDKAHGDLFGRDSIFMCFFPDMAQELWHLWLFGLVAFGIFVSFAICVTIYQCVTECFENRRYTSKCAACLGDGHQRMRTTAREIYSGRFSSRVHRLVGTAEVREHLAAAEGFPAGETYNTAWICDMCHTRSTNVNEPFERCSRCELDICIRCVERNVAQGAAVVVGDQGHRPMPVVYVQAEALRAPLLPNDGGGPFCKGDPSYRR